MHPWRPLGNNAVVTPAQFPTEASDKVGEQLTLNMAERQNIQTVALTNPAEKNYKQLSVFFPDFVLFLCKPPHVRLQQPQRDNIKMFDQLALCSSWLLVLKPHQHSDFMPLTNSIQTRLLIQNKSVNGNVAYYLNANTGNWGDTAVTIEILVSHSQQGHLKH